jgi:hypothetical protein
MNDPAYPFARATAARIHHYFARLLKNAAQPVPLADLATLEAILDVAFWASLRREEGHSPRVSLAVLPPEQLPSPLLLERPVLLSAVALTRVAPAVDRPGIHLGVWTVNGELSMWGTTHHLPPYCLVLEIVAPGLLVVKYSRQEAAGKFVNIAVMEGDQLKVIDQRAASLPDCPSILTPLLGLQSQFQSGASAGTLIQLAVSMRAHGRGGTLLLVPALGSEAWRESILSPTLYSVAPAFGTLPNQRDIDGVAGLTAADGATILNDRFEVLAFGAKIVRRRGSPMVNQVTVTEPIEGATPSVVEPSQLGGTRHISAAQFTHDQRDSLAMVASQDGRFTLFGWSPCEDMVHARRVETLLL